MEDAFIMFFCYLSKRAHHRLAHATIGITTTPKAAVTVKVKVKSKAMGGNLY